MLESLYQAKENGMLEVLKTSGRDYVQTTMIYARVFNRGPSGGHNLTDWL